MSIVSSGSKQSLLWWSLKIVGLSSLIVITPTILSSIKSHLRYGNWIETEAGISFAAPLLRDQSYIVYFATAKIISERCTVSTVENDGSLTHQKESIFVLSPRKDNLQIHLKCEGNLERRDRAGLSGEMKPYVFNDTTTSRLIVLSDYVLRNFVLAISSFFLLIVSWLTMRNFIQAIEVRSLLLFSLISLLYGIIGTDIFQFAFSNHIERYELAKILRIAYSWSFLSIFSKRRSFIRLNTVMHAVFAIATFSEIHLNENDLVGSIYYLSFFGSTLIGTVLLHRVSKGTRQSATRSIALDILAVYLASLLLALGLNLAFNSIAIITPQFNLYLSIIYYLKIREWLNQTANSKDLLASKLSVFDAIGKRSMAIAHRNKSVLAALKALANRLNEDDNKIINLAQSQIESISNDLLSLKNEVREDLFEKMSVHRVSTESIALALQKKYRDRVQAKFGQNDVGVLFLPVPEDSLLEMIEVLVENGIDASETSQSVEVRSEVKNSMLSIFVTDHGSGIPTELQMNLFRFGYTTKSTGNGVGLFSVKQALAKVYGEIEFKSVQNEETVFVVRIPIAKSESIENHV